MGARRVQILSEEALGVGARRVQSYLLRRHDWSLGYMIKNKDLSTVVHGPMIPNLPQTIHMIHDQ